MSTERRAVVYLALIFLSGLLLGGTLMNFAEHYWLHAHAANETDISQHRLIAADMSKRLHLTAAQQEKVDRVLQNTIGQYQQLEVRLEPQFDHVREHDRQQLRAILTPAQRLRFDRIVARIDEEYPINERSAVLAPVPCATPAIPPSN